MDTALAPMAPSARFGRQYALYAVLLGQALTGAIAINFWWPISALHKALFWALFALLALHPVGGANAFITRPRETLFRIMAVRLSSQ
jgi:hypothetical protein